MTISATVTAPARTIPPGPALVDTSTRIEVVQHVPIDDGSKQYFRVFDSADRDAFETAVHADHRVADFRAIDRTATYPLYRIEWGRPPPCPFLYRDDLLIERMGCVSGGLDVASTRALMEHYRPSNATLVKRVSASKSAVSIDPPTTSPRIGTVSRRSNVRSS